MILKYGYLEPKDLKLRRASLMISYLFLSKTCVPALIGATQGRLDEAQ